MAEDDEGSEGHEGVAGTKKHGGLLGKIEDSKHRNLIMIGLTLALLVIAYLTYKRLKSGSSTSGTTTATPTPVPSQTPGYGGYGVGGSGGNQPVGGGGWWNPSPSQTPSSNNTPTPSKSPSNTPEPDKLNTPSAATIAAQQKTEAAAIMAKLHGGVAPNSAAYKSEYAAILADLQSQNWYSGKPYPTGITQKLGEPAPAKSTLTTSASASTHNLGHPASSAVTGASVSTHPAQTKPKKTVPEQVRKPS